MRCAVCHSHTTDYGSGIVCQRTSCGMIRPAPGMGGGATDRATQPSAEVPPAGKVKRRGEDSRQGKLEV